MIYKKKRWKRRNRHSNINLFNAYKSLEDMVYRQGRYVSYDRDSDRFLIKRIGCTWAFLPYSYKLEL